MVDNARTLVGALIFAGAIFAWFWAAGVAERARASSSEPSHTCVCDEGEATADAPGVDDRSRPPSPATRP